MIMIPILIMIMVGVEKRRGLGGYPVEWKRQHRQRISTWVASKTEMASAVGTGCDRKDALGDKDGD